MAKKPFKLTDEMIRCWKECTIAYLEKLLDKPLGPLANTLMQERALTARFRKKGHYLLEPDQPVLDAHYLKKGFVKLYTIDPDTGKEKLFYAWEAGSIVVLYKAFREKLSNDKFYIRLMTDCELVSITRFWMDEVYNTHPTAHLLTEKMLGLKTERRMAQTDILTMIDKKRRYLTFRRKFPQLAEVMTVAEICGFINVTESTIREAKKIDSD